MHQPSSHTRLRRWLRLALLIVCVGALSVAGAAIGHGAGALGAEDVAAPVAAETPARAADLPAAVPSATPAPAPPQPQPTAGAAVQPSAAPTTAPTAAPTTAATASPGATEGVAAGASDPTGQSRPPRRLPQTGGDSAVLLLALVGLTCSIAGMALCLAPGFLASKRDEKE